MDLLRLSLSFLGLAASATCIVAGVYLRKHPDKRPRIPKLTSPVREEEKPETFLTVLKKADDGLESSQE